MRFAGHSAVYHSPTPSVPVLPLTPALQPSPARSMVDPPIAEAPGCQQTASAPVTLRESQAAIQSHAAPSSEDVRALPHRMPDRCRGPPLCILLGASRLSIRAPQGVD